MIVMEARERTTNFFFTIILIITSLKINSYYHQLIQHSIAFDIIHSQHSTTWTSVHPFPCSLILPSIHLLPLCSLDDFSQTSQSANLAQSILGIIIVINSSPFSSSATFRLAQEVVQAATSAISSSIFYFYSFRFRFRFRL